MSSENEDSKMPSAAEPPQVTAEPEADAAQAPDEASAAAPAKEEEKEPAAAAAAATTDEYADPAAAKIAADAAASGAKPAPADSEDPAAAKMEAEQQARGSDEAGDDTPAKAQEGPEDGDGKPPAAAPKPKPKREINPRYKDLRETGSWGALSKKEMYVAGGVFCLIVIGVIIAVVVLVTGGSGDGEEELVPAPPNPVAAPVAAPTSVTAQQEYDLVLEAIAANPAVAALKDDLAGCTDVACFEGKHDDPNENPTVRAMSWLLHVDEDNFSPYSVTRFALVAIYHALNGPEWTTSTNWLDGSADTCDWHGVKCSRTGVVDELDLSRNNLAGKLTAHFGLLSTIQALWLRDNKLTGSLPGKVLGSIPTLSILYLENNMLSGNVPASLRDNGVLQTLFIFNNDFTGVFPREFCPQRINGPKVLIHFGLDCDEVVCTCCEENNCY